MGESLVWHSLGRICFRATGNYLKSVFHGLCLYLLLPGALRVVFASWLGLPKPWRVGRAYHLNLQTVWGTEKILFSFLNCGHCGRKCGNEKWGDVAHSLCFYKQGDPSCIARWGVLRIWRKGAEIPLQIPSALRQGINGLSTFPESFEPLMTHDHLHKG